MPGFLRQDAVTFTYSAIVKFQFPLNQDTHYGTSGEGHVYKALEHRLVSRDVKGLLVVRRSGEMM